MRMGIGILRRKMVQGHPFGRDGGAALASGQLCGQSGQWKGTWRNRKGVWRESRG
jgi:hypothetical protein